MKNAARKNSLEYHKNHSIHDAYSANNSRKNQKIKK